MDVGIAEQLEVGDEAAGPDAEHEAALAHVVELGGLGGDDRGMVVGQVDDRGAERDVLGALRRPAKNISGEGMGSVVAEKCSPSQSSSKPSRSASTDFSLSSSSVLQNVRSGGWTGIMNIPRRMQSSRQIRCRHYGALRFEAEMGGCGSAIGRARPSRSASARNDGASLRE